MGGGAAMRSASKVTGFGGTVLSGGLRGATAPATAPAEQAVRKSSIPVSATLSSSSGTRAGTDVAAVQRPAWEIEGWEFAGVMEDDLVMEAGEPMPRVVFAGVPSFDEAMEATAELKDAVDKVYLSSPESRDLNASNELSGLSVALGTKGTLSAPNHALKAFQLLSTSTEAQNVVASIASDPNVWKVVMQNPVLQDFIESNKTRVEFQEPANPEKPEDSFAKTKTRDFGKWCAGVYNKVKVTTVDLVTYLSSKLNSIFSSDEKEDLTDRALGLTSFLGLATLVIMVVLFKRI